jgi:large subunit ribosomal protein L6
MSKMGKNPICLGSVKVSVDGRKIVLEKGAAKFEHVLPDHIEVNIGDGIMSLSGKHNTKSCKTLWGLHRSLLANKVEGLEKGFIKEVKIVGLGYKAVASGKKLVFSLGFSHKVEYEMPDGVTVDIDKTGQQLKFKSINKELLGSVCGTIRRFRPPEPYKGTGIIVGGEQIVRKAGKAGKAGA